jgi:hypothetical protein
MNIAKASIIPSSDNWDVFALQAYESASKHALYGIVWMVPGARQLCLWPSSYPDKQALCFFEIVRYNEIDELPQPSSTMD